MQVNKQIVENVKVQEAADKKFDGGLFYTPDFQLSDALENIQNIRTKGWVFEQCLYTMAGHLFKFGVNKRVLEDNPKYLADAVYTYSRLQYLAHVRDKEYPPTSTNFSWDMLLSCAVIDKSLFAAYHDFYNEPPFPKKGNYFIVRTMAHLLYLILFEIPNKTEIENTVDGVLTRHKLSQFDKSILLTLKAIYKGDADLFSEHLNVIVQKSWRMRDFLPIPNITSAGIPIYGHALYRLMALTCEKKGISKPEAPVHLFWDSDFEDYVANSENKPEFLIDFAKISPNLYNWLQQLPREFDISLL